jgi:hypothetical protein
VEVDSNTPILSTESPNSALPQNRPTLACPVHNVFHDDSF